MGIASLVQMDMRFPSVFSAHIHLRHVLGQGQGRCDAFPHVHDLLPQLGLSGAVICTQGHNDINLLHGADKWEMREILHPQKKINFMHRNAILF